MTSFILPNAWELEVDMAIGTDMWRNTFSITTTPPGLDTPPEPADAIIGALEAFMLAVHYNDVTLQQTVLRPAIQRVGDTPGSENPPIWIHALNEVCTGNTLYGGAHNSNYLPQDVCIYAKKITTGGRSGKMFFRNILTEVDVQSALGGGWSFSPGPGHFDPAVFNAAVVSDLAGYMTSSPGSGNFYLCVLHLMNLKAGDTRTAKITTMTGMLAERPVWNKAKR